MAATGALPRAGAAGCPDVELVFARGTAEPPGLGRVGDALAAALPPVLKARTLGIYPVDYPASYNFMTTASGADDARDHVTTMAAACPNTKFVLGGFSQGAAAMSMLAGVPPLGNTVGDFGSAPALDPALAPRIAAVAVFGNPGIRFGVPLSSDGEFADRSIDLCSPGDPVCTVGGRDRAAHSDYQDAPYPDEAAQFIAAHV